MLSPIIERELSKEDFVREIHTHKGNLAAPLYYYVEPDNNGCLPEIYDDASLRKANHYLTDNVILKSMIYSEDNMPIVSIVRHDRFTRGTTVSEAKISILKGISDENFDLESLIWDRRSEINGMLVDDINGLLYDYPCDLKWQKSLFSMAMAPVDNFKSSAYAMYETVNYLGDIMKKKSQDDLDLVRGDYTFFIISPSAVSSFTFDGKDSLDRYFRRKGSDLMLLDSRNTLVERKPLWMKDFRSELKGYDMQSEYGKLTSFEINDINDQYN